MLLHLIIPVIGLSFFNLLYNLITIRNKIAKQLGFNNYVEYSLYKLKRFDYDYKDINKFRNNIIKHIIPICSMMNEQKKKELKLDELKYDNDYIDLETRDNKVNFSITNYLTESCIPVITGNYKNNYLDVQTTTHEMGHSFQKYCASIKDKDYIVSPLLKYPTMEVAEIFSYSMELIMMNYLDI